MCASGWVHWNGSFPRPPFTIGTTPTTKHLRPQFFVHLSRHRLEFSAPPGCRKPGRASTASTAPSRPRSPVSSSDPIDPPRSGSARAHFARSWREVSLATGHVQWCCARSAASFCSSGSHLRGLNWPKPPGPAAGRHVAASIMASYSAIPGRSSASGGRRSMTVSGLPLYLARQVQGKGIRRGPFGNIGIRGEGLTGERFGTRRSAIHQQRKKRRVVFCAAKPGSNGSSSSCALATRHSSCVSLVRE